MAEASNPNIYHGNKSYTAMSVQDWSEQSWDKDNVGFHNPNRHPMLVKHIDVMLRARKSLRIFFPLCGKVVDMKWLYDEGHTVIGIEGSAKGVQEFFGEQELSYTTETVAEGKLTLYKTGDNRLQIFCGNIYDFNSTIGGKMQGIWDRGSFVAINKEDRERYSKILIDLMASDCSYLIDIFQFDGSEYSGPPYPIPVDEVTKFYGEKCNIKHIDDRDALSERHRRWGLTHLHETVLELTIK